MKDTLAILCAAALAAGFYMTSAGADPDYILPFGPVTFDDGAGGPYMPRTGPLSTGTGTASPWRPSSTMKDTISAQVLLSMEISTDLIISTWRKNSSHRA